MAGHTSVDGHTSETIVTHDLLECKSTKGDFFMSENGKTFGDLVGHQIVWDEMIQKYGLFSAVIYGRIWRRSQGEDGRCWESLPNIAHLRLVIFAIFAHRSLH